MLPEARHQLLMISDSNVAVDENHLTAMVDELLRPGVGLVTAPIRGVGGSGLGGHLERLQLNTFVMGGVAALNRLFGRVCSMGKGMLLRRRDLERIGGLEALSRFLAEDQVCGEEMRGLGLDVVVAASPVDNRLGKITLRGFADRHLRWARIRRHMAPRGYAVELVTNPLLPALVHVAVAPGRLSLALAALSLAVLSAAGLAAERLLGVRRPLLLYPLHELLRGSFLAVLWPVPYLSATVGWRGNRYRLGRRTLLRPVDGQAWPAADDLAGELAVASDLESREATA
jgi:ceramide glucosyltransferase